MTDELAEAERQQLPLRYSNLAAAFHWVTALLVLFEIWLGLSFADLPRGAERDGLFTWHKTIGALILLIVLARLTYRRTSSPPPYPVELAKWERLAATWTHRLLYLLLVALPIGGIIAVSGRSPSPDIRLLGGVTVPRIPGISKSTGELAANLHSTAAWLLMGVIAIHVAAALKHQFFDRNRAAGRMPPFRSPRDERVPAGGRPAAAD